MIKVKILSPIYVDGFAYRKNVEYQINDEVANILFKKGYCLKIGYIVGDLLA